MIKPIIAIPAFNDNYIWTFIDEKNKHAFIIDPGDADPVIATLEKLEIDLISILLTHHHQDHSGGIKSLVQRWNTASVIGSKKSPCNLLTQRVQEGDKVKFGSSIPFAIENAKHGAIN